MPDRRAAKRAALAAESFLSAIGAGSLFVAGLAWLAGSQRPILDAAWISAPALAFAVATWSSAGLGRGEHARIDAALAAACFLAAASVLALRLSGVDSYRLWTMAAIAGAATGVATLTWKGIRIAATGVPLWRTGQLFGPLFLTDGIATGFGLLAAMSPSPSPGLVSVLAPVSVLRALFMAAAFFQAGADRRTLMRSWTGPAYFAAMALSLTVPVMRPLSAALASIAATGLLRAAILRAPEESESISAAEKLG